MPNPNDEPHQRTHQSLAVADPSTEGTSWPHALTPPRPHTPTPHPTAAAYDAIAATYDEQIRGDEWMRQTLWDAYLRLFRPGQHILDVSCGTGIDAIFLARRGIRVTGIDISPGMIAQLGAKVAQLGLCDQIEAHVLDYASLDNWCDRRFDGMIAAFAGLSTAPDLAPIAATAARLLRPGSPALIHLLNRFSLWECLGLLARRRWTAARQLPHQRERTFPIGGQPVRHYLWWPAEAARAFGPYFEVRSVYALGVLRPPHTARRIPPSLAVALERLERPLRARRPFANWGRLFALELTRRVAP
jgi:SAM-dependent methyltransferase